MFSRALVAVLLAAVCGCELFLPPCSVRLPVARLTDPRHYRSRPGGGRELRPQLHRRLWGHLRRHLRQGERLDVSAALGSSLLLCSPVSLLTAFLALTATSSLR